MRDCRGCPRCLLLRLRLRLFARACLNACRTPPTRRATAAKCTGLFKWRPRRFTNRCVPPLTRPVPRQDTQCLSSRNDAQASDIHRQIDALSSDLDHIRALSERLLVLHPNDLATPTLALDLRDDLHHAAEDLKGIDQDTLELWKETEQVNAAVRKGEFRFVDVREQIGEAAERKEEVEGLARRFARRIKEIKREARGEKSERKEAKERKEPEKLGDYLEPGAYSFPVSALSSSVL